MQFSLFYFADDSAGEGAVSDAGPGSGGRYDLLLDGARFADEHGFSAVWTPERHFHPFGGLYPNPSVTAAAVAMVTSRVALRAGSVVLPLHDPLRVVEEWSVVDNLSHGRVGISFASGWHAADFVLQPDGFEDRKQRLRDGLETVRNLWRGEPIERVDGAGEFRTVQTYPRPLTSELPMWITSSGHIDTFRLAGQVGANLLTHLLGQRTDQLAAKLAAYRRALREAHPDRLGHVTLMLHTFLGTDTGEVRELVREPLSTYLRSSFDLIARYADWVGPSFHADQLRPAEIQLLVDRGFERYFESSGFFGDRAKARATVQAVREIGVDEIA